MPRPLLFTFLPYPARKPPLPRRVTKSLRGGPLTVCWCRFVAAGGARMIRLEGVGKSYDGGAHWVVRDVSFHVREGELLVLLGGSGCGKTTTLKMINRLIEPTEGRVLVAGKDVRDTDPVALRRTIGYVFQGIGLFPHLTVAENVAVVPRLLHWHSTRISQRARELLELVGLPPAQFAHRLPRELSGGQQQRVGFARALAAGPQVILLDEPFGALDPVTRHRLRAEFLALRRDLRLTAVLVTHDMMEALLSADRLAVMNGGRVVQLGTPHELLTRPADDFVAALMAGPREELRQLEALEAARE